MSTSEKNNILNKINDLDRRYMWWAITIIIALVLIRPVGLPVSPSESTKSFKQVIESLPSGSVVMMDFSTTSSSWDEIRPGAYAVAKLLLEKDHKLILIGVNEPEAPLFAELTLENSGWKQEGTKGVDYVNLGYFSGGETTVFNLARNFQIVEKDVEGVSISELPILNDIEDAGDIDLVIGCEGDVMAYYLRHWGIPYGKKMLVCVTSAQVFYITPYYESGDLHGYLGGQKGISEFEYLTGYPGEAIRSVDAQSLASFFFITIIVLGNIAELSERRKR